MDRDRGLKDSWKEGEKERERERESAGKMMLLEVSLITGIE